MTEKKRVASETKQNAVNQVMKLIDELAEPMNLAERAEFYDDLAGEIECVSDCARDEAADTADGG